MKQVIDHAKSNIVFILVCAVSLAFLGQVLPTIYFRYFDNRVYYSIKSPVNVQKDQYKAGETVVVEFDRNSLITTNAVSVVDLVLYQNNREVEHYRRDVSIEAGSQEIEAIFCLPTTLDPGGYLLRGVISFRVRGVDKTASFYTESFEVIK